MSDAAEVLNVIYENLALVADGGQLIGRLFQWNVRQYLHCSCCGQISHDMRHTQTFYHTFATALRAEAAAADRVEPLGTLLARVEAQEEKTCDRDLGTHLPGSRNLDLHIRRPFCVEGVTRLEISEYLS